MFWTRVISSNFHRICEHLSTANVTNILNLRDSEGIIAIGSRISALDFIEDCVPKEAEFPSYPAMLIPRVLALSKKKNGWYRLLEKDAISSYM